MGESQKHGFEFQQNVFQLTIETILENISINYTNKWDVPPISIKSFNFASQTIEFGSIERIFKNTEDFILVLIGYEQQNDVKLVIFSDCILITNQHLQKLKGNLTIGTINELNEKLKNFKLGFHENARKWAKEQKQIYNTQTDFDIRFKIDSKNQRRIQCALNLKTLYRVVGKELKIENKLQLQNITSSVRKRNS